RDRDVAHRRVGPWHHANGARPPCYARPHSSRYLATRYLATRYLATRYLASRCLASRCLASQVLGHDAGCRGHSQDLIAIVSTRRPSLTEVDYRAVIVLQGTGSCPAFDALDFTFRSPFRDVA